MATLQAVLFDADGVLQRAPRDFLARVAAAMGAKDDEAAACLADIFAAETPALTNAADYADTLAPVMAKWRPSVDVAGILDLWRQIEVDHSVLGLVADLRAAGVRCAIASNQQSYRARHMSEALGYRERFDHEFYSCHLGCAKPEAAFFAAMARAGGLDPPASLFLDDRPENVEAARSAGYRAEVFVLGEVGTGAAALRPVLAGHGLKL